MPATPTTWSVWSRSSQHCPKCSRLLPSFHKRQATQTQYRRSISTTSQLNDSIAAPPIDFSKDQGGSSIKARIVPASPSYFSGQPHSTDKFLQLKDLLRRYQTLPTVGAGEVPRAAWRSAAQYRVLVGEPVKMSKYHKVLEILRRLNRIHPAVMPKELSDALQVYKRDVDPHAVVRQPGTVDEDGKAYGVGRRKSSSAKVYLVPGEGRVLVNGKGINMVFGRIVDRESALWALKATQRMDKYNVWALVKGGGTTGQAEAITLGLARALMIFEPALKPALRRGEFFLIPRTFRSFGHTCAWRRLLVFVCVYGFG